MAEAKLIIAHYDEIAMKGGNRRYFERKLARNIQRCSPVLADVAVQPIHDRILIGPVAADAWDELKLRFSEMPGLSWFAEVRRLPAEVDALNDVADEFCDPNGPRTFRVVTRRADKQFPLNSVEINRQVGRMIQDRTGWDVDLKQPDISVHVDVTRYCILVYHSRHRGLGGLPVGTGGKLVCLMSGGIDSPVAAFKMMCRGCSVVLVHFHNLGHHAARVRRKVIRLAEQLGRFQPVCRLYLVPFAAVQTDLVAAVPPELRMVAYRRAMIRLATPILKREGARAFVTGDSVGQVASQTIENLSATYAVATYPILAPLIGESKRAIVELAQQIGTYETSILPGEDCCQYLVAKSPETKCAAAELAGYEQRFPLDHHRDAVLREAERVEFKQWKRTGEIREPVGVGHAGER